jgi:HEAT repeat protein
MVDKFPTDRSEAMTAVSLTVRSRLPEALRREPGAATVLPRSVGLLLGLPPQWSLEKGTIDLYYWTYGAQALSRLAPEGWKAWDGALAKALVPNQRADGPACEARGSWDPVDPWGPDAGRLYMTAMCSIALSAPGRVPEPAAAAAALARDLARADLSRAIVLRRLKTAEMRRPAGVEAAVAGRLRSEDPLVRAAAARALAATAPTAATASTLGKTLGDKDVGVRRAALEALASLPPETAAAAAAAALGAVADADPAVRRAALRVAGAASPPPPGFEPALAARLADADARVRAIAAGLSARTESGAAAGREVLATLATDASAEVRREALAAAAALVPVVPPLDMTFTKALEDADPQASAIAAGALLRAGLSTERAQAALLQGIRAPTPAARLAALEALAAAVQPSAAVAAALVPAATSGARSHRVAALRALGRAGGADALPYLYGAAADPDASVAKAGREAAAAVGLPPAVQAERLAQAMEGGSPAVLFGGRRGLAILGAASLEAVRRRTVDPKASPEQRLAFLPVVADLGAAARPLEAGLVTQLAAETSPSVAAAIADALAALPVRDARAVAPLSTWAGNPNEAVARAAVRGLGAMAPTVPAAEDALASVAESPRAKAPTRLAVLQAIRGIKAPRPNTIDAVLAVLDRTDVDAADAEALLGEIGRPAVSRLAARLGGGSPQRQLRLLGVVERLGPKAKAARSAVEKLTSSPIPPVAEAAQRALDAIGK